MAMRVSWFGYSVNSKAFRVFNTRTRKVEKNLHINFLENKPNVAGSGPEWLFDIDSLTKSMNYEPVTTGNQTNANAAQLIRILPGKEDDDVNDGVNKENGSNNQERTDNTRIFDSAYDDEDVGAEADLNNLETTMNANDIIFGFTKKSLSTEFEQLMHKRFQMSSTGELTFFLGQQVSKRKDGIFISQDKDVCDNLKKFDFSSVKTTSTPMETHKPLLKDADGTDVDVHLYRYLKGQPTLGLWYTKDSPFDLIAYSDSDYAGASIDRKSTIGGCQFLVQVTLGNKEANSLANSTTKQNTLLLQIVWNGSLAPNHILIRI
ncbi:hypothetical protein Tco_0115674 [Tanacetum coccineum]